MKAYGPLGKVSGVLVRL